MTPKSFRTKHSLTQQKAAQLFGVTVRAWKHWEHGTREMGAPAYRLMLVIDLLGTDSRVVIALHEYSKSGR